jgi:hypothetical protein
MFHVLINTKTGENNVVTDNVAIAEEIRKENTGYPVFFTAGPTIETARGLAAGAADLYDTPFTFRKNDDGGFSAVPTEAF